jgi:hypothetical protein
MNGPDRPGQVRLRAVRALVIGKRRIVTGKRRVES